LQCRPLLRAGWISRRASQIQIKPTVSIIGAGRLGTALALALASRGYSVEAVVARSLSHAQKARRALADGLALSESQLSELPASTLILIATPDDVISSVARKLAKSQKGKPKGRTVLHTSGALSSEMLKPLQSVGFHTGSLHPLVSVSDSRVGAADLQAAFYCLEGDPEATRLARRIVRDLGGRSFSIDSRQKALYHASAVMASGHMVALFDLALEMLTRCGLNEATARKVLMPLIESTVRNLSNSTPARALTGTFARGDLATVRKHLEALISEGQGDALAAYRLLGKRSLKLLKENGGDAAVLKQIQKILDQAR
jgi:predicted short-subunit dehydrogenase-like oxidoreductase (DUF2520 family)